MISALLSKTMKLRTLLFLVLLSSCMENKPVASNPITIYNPETYLDLIQKNKDVNFVVIDTACINQRKRALSDLSKGELYYFHSKSWLEWKEMEVLLAEFNIGFKDYEGSCLRVSPEFNEYCYEEVMWAEIDKRIGAAVIDSLWEVAERNFVLKYPDSLYMKDGIDVREKYQLE